MSEWREDNFLEKLAHSSPKHAGINLCPEAQSLCTRADSEETGTISGKLSQHIEHCSVCSDLHRRLMLFDQPASLGLDSDAIEAEKRLDSWLKGFLASQSMNSQAPLVVSAPSTVPLRSTSNPRPFWQMQWALAATAIAVIALGVLYIRRSITAQAPAPMIAQATSDGRSPAQAESQVPTEQVSATEQHPQAVAPKPPRTSGSSKVVSPPRPAANVPNQPPDAHQNNSPTIQPAPVVLAPQVATRTPSLPANAPNQSASANTITPRTATVAPVSRSSGPLMQAPGVPAARTNTASRSTAPPTVQLPAGTRIWLTLDSVTSQPEGRFQFRATLLLPVTASGTLLLGKGAQVIGSGQTIQNETSIQITELVTSGQRYKLSPASSGVSKMSGSGKAVRFESGQVLEMWLDSLSTFVAAGGSSTGPPN
jgi:hypothetical protein